MGLATAAIAGPPADHAVSAAIDRQGSPQHRRSEGAQGEQRMAVDVTGDPS